MNPIHNYTLIIFGKLHQHTFKSDLPIQVTLSVPFCAICPKLPKLVDACQNYSLPQSAWFIETQSTFPALLFISSI